ncbi:hypothetical protein B0T14DRAFT_521565 [Immersiella caudata]|uniref:Uncharacterized protein n=1 Tax=Immersiella caudata TaxID=314043 RepID=A0AA39WS66_9PEZI|nr:hypothetical protein B0T14DRAFT_521565 [Immersiella caudata]
MPSAKPRFFSRRRETTEVLVLPSQDSALVGTETKSRNKLRKQPPSCPLQRTAAADLELLMGNKTSKLENVPRPTRPPRPSANELPDLPSQPLYKALNAQQLHPPKNLDDEKPKIPEKALSRQPSIASRKPSFTGIDWPLGDDTRRGRPSSRAAQTVPRKLYSCSADAAFPDKQRRPVIYDRASHLAESYRALLPDRSDVESDYDVPLTDEPVSFEPLPAPTPSRAHKWSWDPREPAPQQSKTTHCLLHLGNRPLFRGHSSTTNLKAKSVDDPFAQNPRTPSWIGTGMRATPLSQPRAASTASSSSLTAVESCPPYNDPFVQASSISHQNSTTTFAAEDDNHWNLNAEEYEKGHYTSQPSSYPHHAPSSHQHTYDVYQSSHGHTYDTNTHYTSPYTSPFQDLSSGLQTHHNHPVHPPHPISHAQISPQRQQRRRTSDDLGLQICGEMLSDQLRKTFIGGNPKNNPESNKLQVLLLIEAYEATLESCRREVSHPPLTRGGEAEGIKKHHMREATRIIDHWLGVLYRIYDEDFGGDGTERGNMRNGEMF